MKRRNYEISNDGQFVSVGFDMEHCHHHVVWVSCELPPSLATAIAEISCAALNAVEAAKQTTNSRIKRGTKRTHAKRTS